MAETDDKQRNKCSYKFVSINHFPNKRCLIAFSDVMMHRCEEQLRSKETGISKSWKLGRGEKEKPVETRPGAGRWDVRCAAKGMTSALAAVQREKPESVVGGRGRNEHISLLSKYHSVILSTVS